MTLREKALSFAIKAHEGQKRKDGKDYITHPIAVAEIAEEIAKKYGVREDIYLDDLYVMSVEHDVREDRPQFAKEMLEEFGPYIYSSVGVLSRQKQETYFDFIGRIIRHHKTSKDPLALIVKIADITHNLSDLQEGSMKDKYRFAKYLLEKTLQTQ